MITKEKLEIYRKYKGYYDGFYIQNKDKEEIISLFDNNDDWYKIDNIISNLFIVNKGLASQDFKEFVKNEMKIMTNNSDELKELLIAISKEFK